MKNTFYKLLIVLFALSPLVIALVMANLDSTKTVDYEEKVYVALEGEGRVAVFDPMKGKLLRSIDLSGVQNERFVEYSAHNVQVAPDGSKVLVTGNVVRGVMGEEEEEEFEIEDGLMDKLFVIDPLTDEIVSSVSVGVDLHLAHVVVDAGGEMAYLSSQEKGLVYVVDLGLEKVVAEYDFGEGSQPHGLRMSIGGDKLFVALIEGRAIGEVALSDGVVKEYPLAGRPVQTAVTPDGQYVFASVYDTKQVAWINLKSGQQGYVDLPVEAKGPVQLYPTPDSQFVYVADQGYYFDQATSNMVYRLNITEKSVDQSIVAGEAPHGVVVDAVGEYAYVTNLLGKSVSVVELATGLEVEQISVGKMPNGISIWHKNLGGTP